MADIRVALYGYGYWGRNLARNIAATDGLALAAVIDCDAARGVAATADYPALLVSDTDDIDAVAIATPASTHFEIAHAALEAGKHVLVEKPLATNYADACALRDLAEQRGLVLMVDHTFVYTGAVRELHARVAAGDLGEKLLYFDSVRMNLGVFQPDVDVIWDLAPHDLSILLRLVDRPTSVRALGSDPTGYGKATSAHLTLGFLGGFVATIHVSWLSPVKIRRTMVAGSTAMAVYDDVEPSEKVKLYDSGVALGRGPQAVEYRTGDMIAPKLDTTEALARAVAHFRDCIDATQPSVQPLTGADAGVDVVRILESASMSLSTDAKVYL